MVEALRYKPEDRGFDSRWCHWNFLFAIDNGRTVALGLAQPVTEMSTRNISWGCVGLTTLQSSCADCLEIWEPQLPGTLWVCPGLIMGLIYLYLYLTNNHSRDVDCFLNVMAHAQKPDFVFMRNVRVHLNRRGRQFRRLLAAEVCASAVVMLDTPCSEVV